MLPLSSKTGFQGFSVSKYTHWPTHPQPCLASVQFSSVFQSCTILCNPMDCSTPGLLVYHQLPEFTQTHVHWVSDAIQPSHPLSSSLLLLPTIFPSITVFSNESALHIRCPKYWSFSSRPFSVCINWLECLSSPLNWDSLKYSHQKFLEKNSKIFIYP